MNDLDILAALGLEDVDRFRARRIADSFRRAWDVEIGRRCLTLLTQVEAEELQALTNGGDARRWLDTHLPAHRAIVRAAFEEVRRDFIDPQITR